MRATIIERTPIRLARRGRSALVALTSAVVVACLAARAALAAPPPGHFVDSGDGTVLDSATGLRWQRTVIDSTFTFAGASTYCAGLTSGGVAAGTWRVPTRRELLTIVDWQRMGPSIDPSAFPSTPSTSFWSSTPLAGSASYAWDVDFVLGNTYSAGISSMHRVRCVR